MQIESCGILKDKSLVGRKNWDERKRLMEICDIYVKYRVESEKKQWWKKQTIMTEILIYSLLCHLNPYVCAELLVFYSIIYLFFPCSPSIHPCWPPFIKWVGQGDTGTLDFDFHIAFAQQFRVSALTSTSHPDKVIQKSRQQLISNKLGG